MKLVEVVNTEFTNAQTTETVIELAKQMGKVPVLCKDSPGFIVNRVARPYYIESLRLVEEKLQIFRRQINYWKRSGLKWDHSN